MGNFKEDIARIRAFVFDVDGVFTDGSIVPLTDGDFIRTYNAKDGYAVAYALSMGYPVAIISGGRGATLEQRFKVLKVTKLCLNCVDKGVKIEEFMREQGLAPDEVAYMGDDIPDLEAMKHVGMPVCPSDAVPEVMEISRYVSPYPGGRGCVRDIVEQVLRARGDWAKHYKGVTCLPSA